MIITPKNWGSFQHYKDRSPTWIKLHRVILDDYVFACLPVDSRALAPMMWLLASEYEDGKITATYDEIAFRLRMPLGDLKAALKPLFEGGFFTVTEPRIKPLATPEPTSIPEKEEERELQVQTEGERAASPPTAVNGKGPKQPRLPLEPKPRPTRLPEDWKLSHKNTDDARREGLSEVQMAQEVKKFRNFWVAKSGKDATKMNWDATWHNWCIRAAGDLGCTPRLSSSMATPSVVKLSLDEWKLVLRNYAITTNWSGGYGPAPGKPGCLVPQELLKDDEP